MDELQGIVAREGVGAGVRLVEERAHAGAPAALAMLGQWRLFGLYGPRDVQAGAAAIMRAAEAGDIDSRFTQVALVASGAAGRADPDRARAMLDAIDHPLAQRQRGLLDSMAGGAATPTTLCDDPSLVRINGLWSRDECAYVIERATPRMQASWVVDPVTGRRLPNPIRSSDGTNFPAAEEDLVIAALNERIARATGTAAACGEPLHILRYAPGQEYRWHLDALPGVDNQRVLTALVYLSDAFSGGATAFEHAGEVRGGIGDAIVFANVGRDGKADPRTRHAGLAVTSGTKWLATRWIRARPIDAWRPETWR